MAIPSLVLCLLNAACGGGSSPDAFETNDDRGGGTVLLAVESTGTQPREGGAAIDKTPATAPTTASSSGPAVSTTIASVVTADYAPPGYTLSFSDEFSGTSLDRSKWCTRYVYGGGPALQVPDKDCTPGGRGNLDHFNDEQQRYVDFNTARKVMHEVRNGILRLHATKTRRDGNAAYESAMIRSKVTFRPSPTESLYVTARIRMPNVVGSWPAFWLAPTLTPSGDAVWPPEIDMLEGALNGVEDKENMYHSAAIQQNPGGVGSGGSAPLIFNSTDFESKYRNYTGEASIRGVWIEIGMEWTDIGFCTYFNGSKKSCESYEWKDNSGALAPSGTVLLNLAVGGQWAGRHGVDEKKFPTSFDIDRVRVYKKAVLE